MLDLVFQNQTADSRYAKGFGEASKKYTSKFFEKILVAGIKELKLGNPKKSQSDLGAGKNIAVSVNLVGEGRIRELNRKYRKKNKVTDVLSFPMSGRSQKKLPVTSYQLPVTDLGDIFICLSFAKREAKSENIDIERKLAELTVHGFLHLAGYDHEWSKRDAGRMAKLERYILNGIKNL